MNIPVSLPLDNDGFLRCKSPNCLQQFKWHNGPASEEAENQPAASAYYCPFCGAAATDQWWTTEQVKYTQGVAMPAAIQALDDELGSVFKGTSSKNFKTKQTGPLDVPNEPDPPTEPDDMMIIASPCHGWEPIKVPEDTTSPFRCLICGQAFAL